MTTITVAHVREGEQISTELPDGLNIKDAPLEMLDQKNPGCVRVAARVGKVFTPDLVKLSDYGAPYRYSFTRHEVETLPELAELLQFCSRHDRVIVMGDLNSYWEDDPKGSHRRLGENSSSLNPGEFGVITMRPSRLLTIDLDGPSLPGYNPLDPIPALNEFVLPLLGDAFTRAGYVAQVTSSQKLDPNATARLRLWYLMKEPLSPEGRSRLLRQLKTQNPKLKIDPSSCNTAQLNYTSPPIIVPALTFDVLRNPLQNAQNDVLPRRWFMVEGEPLDVAEPVVEVRSINDPSGEGATRLFEPGSELLALEMPGDDIHPKILTATFNLARHYRSRISTEDVVEMVHNRLIELTADGEQYSNRKERITGKTIRTEIASAYESALNKVMLRVGPLTEEVTSWRSLEETAQLLNATLNAAITDKSHRVHVIKATCGLGKTHSTLEMIRDSGEICYLFTPDHTKAAEVVRDAKNMGISTVHIKGKAEKDEEQTPLCAKFKTIELHSGEEGYRYINSAMVCKGKRVEEKPTANEYATPERVISDVSCPYYTTCGYNRQFTQKAQLYVFAHASLMHSPPIGTKLNVGLPRPAFSVIDENPSGTLVKTETFPMASLRKWNQIGTRHIIRRLCDALEDGKDLLQTFRAIVAERAADYETDEGEMAEILLNRLARAAWVDFRKEAGNIHAGMTAEETLLAVSKTKVAAPWLGLLGVIKKAEASCESLQSVRFSRNKAGEEFVSYDRIEEMNCPLGKKVLVLDATPSEIELKALFWDFQLHEFEVRENTFEVQVLGPTFSKTRLTKWAEDNSKEERFTDLTAFTRMVSGLDNAGVVTFKGVKEHLPLAEPSLVEAYGITPEEAEKIEKAEEERLAGMSDKAKELAETLGKGRKYSLPVMTFKALLGQNAFEKKEVLLIAGRIMIPAHAAERKAGILLNDPKLGRDVREYGETKAKHFVRVGNGKIREIENPIPVRTHPNPGVDSVREHNDRSEYIQAKGRLRGVRAEKPKLIINCSESPTGSPVDRLYQSLTDLIGPRRLVTLMELHGGYLPLRAGYLRETFPKVFPSLKAAQRFVEDVLEWWEYSECRFFRMVLEQERDLSCLTPWRKGSRKDRPKTEGDIICIRQWAEVRKDPDLAFEEQTRNRHSVYPTLGIAA